MPRLLLTMVLMGYVSVASAGLLEGELFGYKLGSQYPLTDRTKRQIYYGRGAIELVAEQPEKPDDFQRVVLVTTVKTFTIASINGFAEFPDEARAKTLAAYYADLLDTLYASKCIRKTTPFPWHLLTLLCDGQFELTVAYLTPNTSGEMHTVLVEFAYDDHSEARKRLSAQFSKELKELETEEKHDRLEQAKKSQKLKGLQ